ncbi:MAG TPA: hypothetical protein VIY48_10740 [Candidatus Paceibacterota bacterium]
MELTDEELNAIQSIVYDEVYYGDDWVVYATPGANDFVDALRSGLEKLDAEIKRRDRL